MNKTITWTQLNTLMKGSWAIKDGDDRICTHFENKDDILKLRFDETDDLPFEEICFNKHENEMVEYNGSEVLLKSSDGEIIWLMMLYELYMEEALKLFNV